NKNNANGQQPPTTQSNNSVWPQAGSKPAVAGTNGPPTSAAPASNNNTPNNTTPNNATNTTKQQLEQLNNMREAIFSQDGWGGQHVNQDTNWDIPASPEPSMKMEGAGPPTWKPAVNNGTDLWEANLRNGGQPPPPPQQKTPWGHTPASNIGGTWGEDDDATDSSNVWTGVPNNQQQWGGNNSNNAMWGAGGNASGWGDPRAAADPRATAAAAAAVTMDTLRPDMRAVAAASGLDPRQLDPREQIRQIPGGDMRGDPRAQKKLTGARNQQQSRLNQWISKDKEENSEFSRAPGSSSKPVATSPNMAPLGLTQSDGPWSSGRSGDTGWPDSSGGDTSNDVKDAQWATTAQPSLTDLVPEFEPGKPWKGNQIKSIEDDPTITPGSVVRSPLSIATIKENELFSINANKSPPATDAMQPLSSTTWSFNPPTTNAFTSSKNPMQRLLRLPRGRVLKANHQKPREPKFLEQNTPVSRRLVERANPRTVGGFFWTASLPGLGDDGEGDLTHSEPTKFPETEGSHLVA
ncbi:protein Gawky-like, partial [Sitophilus oryzae]|uniref:Protein Gawky-like n=1 Tax=Sitophilus oryzae TaxID=7048 RepID=A0A6J2X6D3_SITOR